MVRFIADIYRMVNQLIKNRIISLSIALLYISLLNVVTIYGLCDLLQNLFSFLGSALFLFRSPYVYMVFLAVLGFNLWLMLPLKNLSKEKGKPVAVGAIILYSFVSLLLYLYTHYESTIFQ